MKEGMRQVDATSGNLLVYIDDYSAPRLIRLGKDKKEKWWKRPLKITRSKIRPMQM